MKKKVKRTVTIVCCDNCKKELSGRYQSLHYSVSPAIGHKYGEESYDFCNDACQEEWKIKTGRV